MIFGYVGMEAGGPSDIGGSSGAKVRTTGVGGPVNWVVRRRVLRYQRRVREPYRLHSPFGQMNISCECRHTYRNPDEVVMAIDDERHRLGRVVDTLRAQLDETSVRTQKFSHFLGLFYFCLHFYTCL